MLYDRLHWHTYSPQTLDIYNNHAKKLAKYPIYHFIQSNRIIMNMLLNTRINSREVLKDDEGEL